MWQIPSLSPQKRFWNVCMNSEHTYKRCWKKWFSLLSSLAQTVIPPFSPLLSTEKSLTANLADKHSPFMKHLSVGSKLVNLVIWWRYGNIFSRGIATWIYCTAAFQSLTAIWISQTFTNNRAGCGKYHGGGQFTKKVQETNVDKSCESLQISKSTRTYWPASDTDRIRGELPQSVCQIHIAPPRLRHQDPFRATVLCTLYKAEQYKEYIKNTVVHCVTWRVVHNCNSAIWSAIGLWLLVI